MSVAGQSSFQKKAKNLPENVLKDDTSIWHSYHSNNGDKVPYIALKMEREENVFMVKVVDRLGCEACSGRYKDVEVRVSSTLSYKSKKSLNLDNSVSCGIKSGDGIDVTVHK